MKLKLPGGRGVLSELCEIPVSPAWHSEPQRIPVQGNTWLLRLQQHSNLEGKLSSQKLKLIFRPGCHSSRARSHTKPSQQRDPSTFPCLPLSPGKRCLFVLEISEAGGFTGQQKAIPGTSQLKLNPLFTLAPSVACISSPMAHTVV